MKKKQAKKYYVYTIAYFDQIVYVGKTSNMSVRKSMHRTQRGTHSSAIPVDVDMSKVVFNVVAEFNNEEEALKYEDELMLQYNTMDNGWNKQRSGLIMVNDVKAYYQDYYEAHKEEIAVYKRDYYEAHKEEKAAYNASHKEEKAAYGRDYRDTHREEIAAYMREYMRDYRARKKASVGQIEAI